MNISFLRTDYVMNCVTDVVTSSYVTSIILKECINLIVKVGMKRYCVFFFLKSTDLFSNVIFTSFLLFVVRW